MQFWKKEFTGSLNSFFKVIFSAQVNKFFHLALTSRKRRKKRTTIRHPPPRNVTKWEASFSVERLNKTPCFPSPTPPPTTTQSHSHLREVHFCHLRAILPVVLMHFNYVRLCVRFRTPFSPLPGMRRTCVFGG